MEYSQRLEIKEQLNQTPQLYSAFWWRWRHRYRTRRQLHALLINDSDRVHMDLGLSAEAAMTEIRKPFWQA